ncbi:hypothetical protein [Amedibacillus sp. YH-ame10]
MKKNQKGSALLWAIVVIGVLSILIAGSLTIAYSYYHRTLQTNSKRQAYLTAKGVVEDIAENIKKGNEEYLALFMDTSKDEFTPILGEGQRIPLTVSLPTTANVGDILESYILINKTDKSMKGYITIGVIAEYDSQKYEVRADLKLGYIDGIGDKWQIIRYYQNGDADEVFNNVTLGYKVGNDMREFYEYFSQKMSEGMNQESAVRALVQYMKEDKSWQNVDETMRARLEALKYFDDKTLRDYLANRNNEHTYIPYNVDEVTAKDKLIIPTAVTLPDGTQSIKKVEKSISKDKLLSKPYYIQPKYTNWYNLLFVFANESATPSNGGVINLVFYNGHWYYINQIRLTPNGAPMSLAPTSFDSSNDAEDKWNYLVANFLTEENMLQ